MTINRSENDYHLPWQESFKNIECYKDEQVSSVLHKLIRDNALTQTLEELFHSSSTHHKVDLECLTDIDSIDDFQTWVEDTFFPLIASSFTELSFSGLEQLEPQKSYVFISNHRDIIMDPLLLNRALRRGEFSTAHCAIGDNLLEHPSANDLALLNRCFKVFRSLKSPRAMLKAMKVQSEYIRYLHFTKNENIWIAQKEGRAKDSIDKTNPALIKMLSLAKPKTIAFSEYLTALNIVPVSFSYEWDPCDIDKAKEVYETQLNGHYEKDRLDDFISSKKGIAGFKGEIHVSFGEPLKLTEIDDHKSVADQIDLSIYAGYKRYPVNYASFKKVNAKYPEPCMFERRQIAVAEKELETKLATYDEAIKRLVYQAYAQVIK